MKKTYKIIDKATSRISLYEEVEPKPAPSINQIIDYYYFNEFGKNYKFAARFFQDKNGRWWEIKPYNWSVYSRYAKNVLGDFPDIEKTIEYARYLRAPFASFRMFKITRPDGEVRYELAKLSKQPIRNKAEDQLRPFDFRGFQIQDVTDKARQILYEQQVKYRIGKKFRPAPEPEGFQFREKEDLIKLAVKPRKTTKVKKYSYYEKGGKWIFTETPDKYWNKRDTVEVYIRENNPSKHVAIYKKAGNPTTYYGWRDVKIFSSFFPWRTPIEKQRIMEKLEIDALERFKKEMEVKPKAKPEVEPEVAKPPIEKNFF